MDLRGSEQECGATALDSVRRAIENLAPGETLAIHTAVADQAFAIRAWAARTRHPILEDARQGKEFRIVVEQTAGA